MAVFTQQIENVPEFTMTYTMNIEIKTKTRKPKYISSLRIICFLISRLFAAMAKLTKNIGQGKSVKMASIVVAKLKDLKNS